MVLVVWVCVWVCCVLGGGCFVCVCGLTVALLGHLSPPTRTLGLGLVFWTGYRQEKAVHTVLAVWGLGLVSGKKEKVGVRLS